MIRRHLRINKRIGIINNGRRCNVACNVPHAWGQLGVCMSQERCDIALLLPWLIGVESVHVCFRRSVDKLF